MMNIKKITESDEDSSLSTASTRVVKCPECGYVGKPCEFEIGDAETSDKEISDTGGEPESVVSLIIDLKKNKKGTGAKNKVIDDMMSKIS